MLGKWFTVISASPKTTPPIRKAEDEWETFNGHQRQGPAGNNQPQGPGGTRRPAKRNQTRLRRASNHAAPANSNMLPPTTA